MWVSILEFSNQFLRLLWIKPWVPNKRSVAALVAGFESIRWAILDRHDDPQMPFHHYAGSIS